MSSNRERIDHLLAQYHEVPVAAAHAAFDEQIGAWKQAMAEFGVPEHPGGKCPIQPCPCSAMAELVTLRACELMGLTPAEGQMAAETGFGEWPLARLAEYRKHLESILLMSAGQADRAQIREEYDAIQAEIAKRTEEG
jgi:hypothetical protein